MLSDATFDWTEPPEVQRWDYAFAFRSRDRQAIAAALDDLVFEFASSLHQMVAGPVFEKVSSKILGEFQKRVHSVHGKGRG